MQMLSALIFPYHFFPCNHCPSTKLALFQIVGFFQELRCSLMNSYYCPVIHAAAAEYENVRDIYPLRGMRQE